jgi:hypothetical protein
LPPFFPVASAVELTAAAETEAVEFEAEEALAPFPAFFPVSLITAVTAEAVELARGCKLDVQWLVLRLHTSSLVLLW